MDAVGGYYFRGAVGGSLCLCRVVGLVLGRVIYIGIVVLERIGMGVRMASFVWDVD